MAATTEKGCAATADLPRALVAAQAHDGGASAVFLASTAAA
jgi:hypothetical protein